MTRDEQRLAWRVYSAGALSTIRNAELTHGDIQSIEDVADRLLKAEQQRFDGPDHSADASKMVEPREWVDLTEAEIRQIVATWYPTQAELVRFTQDLLREKNGGTR
jgi:hypothetical protein